MAWYRLKIDWTYNTVPNANTAVSNINNTLANNGRSETATRSGSNVTLTIDNLTEAEAETLRVALIPAWNVGTRTAGKSSVVRRDEASG